MKECVYCGSVYENKENICASCGAHRFVLQRKRQEEKMPEITFEDSYVRYYLKKRGLTFAEGIQVFSDWKKDGKKRAKEQANEKKCKPKNKTCLSESLPGQGAIVFGLGPFLYVVLFSLVMDFFSLSHWFCALGVLTLCPCGMMLGFLLGGVYQVVVGGVYQLVVGLWRKFVRRVNFTFENFALFLLFISVFFFFSFCTGSCIKAHSSTYKPTIYGCGECPVEPKN